MTITAETQIYPTHTCFDDAIEFIELLIKENPDLKEDIKANILIVHSICLMPDGRPYAHAWVEDKKDDTSIFRGIIDGEATYLIAPRTEYYERFRVQETTKYTLYQALEENRKSNTYGPWKEKYRKLTK